MRVLTKHSFPNGRTICVGYLEAVDQKEFGIPEEDVLALTFIGDTGETSYCLRPDEALVIIRLLADAVNKAVKGYHIGLKK